MSITPSEGDELASLWHQRLGHLHFTAIKWMLGGKTPHASNICETFIKTKHRHRFIRKMSERGPRRSWTLLVRQGGLWSPWSTWSTPIHYDPHFLKFYRKCGPGWIRVDQEAQGDHNPPWWTRTGFYILLMFIKKPVPRATRPFETIHSDVCGPFKAVSFSGARYFILYIDHYTCFCKVYFLHTKEANEVTGCFWEFRERIRKIFPKWEISRFRCDNGKVSEWYKPYSVKQEQCFWILVSLLHSGQKPSTQLCIYTHYLPHAQLAISLPMRCYMRQSQP